MRRTLHVEVGFKSSAAHVPNIEVDAIRGRQQRRIDEQPTHVDALAVAAPRGLAMHAFFSDPIPMLRTPIDV